jgi:ABC-type molybdenum transport system ATPase subunit/photorepair protein PhrA
MIYECPQGHICFSKDSLYICGMKGCGKTTLVLSPIDIKWFYKINKTGLCINNMGQNSRLLLHQRIGHVSSNTRFSNLSRSP